MGVMYWQQNANTLNRSKAMPTIDDLWRAVEQHPDDADAKRQLAGALGDTLAGIALKWCATNDKHPEYVDSFMRWCWYEATPANEQDPPNIHPTLWDIVRRDSWESDAGYEEMSDAFAALGRGLRELRELVKE